MEKAPSPRLSPLDRRNARRKAVGVGIGWMSLGAVVGLVLGRWAWAAHTVQVAGEGGVRCWFASCCCAALDRNIVRWLEGAVNRIRWPQMARWLA